MRSVYIVSITLLFFVACSPRNSVPEIEDFYIENKAELIELTRLFSDSTCNITILSYNNNEIRVRTKEAEFYSLEEFNQNHKTSVNQAILQRFTDMNMKFLSGRKADIEILFDWTDKCVKLQYNKLFDEGSELNQKKISNFKTKEKYDWIYVLDEKWYIRTDCD